MRKIRKGDRVRALSGRDKGREGLVLVVLEEKKGLFVLVEGINLVTKHIKARPQEKMSGRIQTKEIPLAACKVALIDPSTNKTSRIGIKVLENGDKVRFFKSSGNEVSYV